ncbi:MAG: response regulator [Caulobacteraceae bacterium]|jgi:CheY-like chemotaxis protein|nr:response regulator [Caulobacteraceae bacterium]
MESKKTRGKFLVVEDEFMIAMLIEDYLSELGHEMAWQTDNIPEALQIIESNDDIDGAILDMNLRGETVRPIAEELRTKQIPFCFMTGYGAGVTTSHPDVPIISKPFDMAALRDTISILMAGGQRV